MRRIAVVMLLMATGCAAAPAEEAGEGPRSTPAAMSASGEVILEPDDNGGGCGLPSAGGGAPAEVSGGAIGDGGEGGGDDVEASWGGEICRTACWSVASVGCNTILDACVFGEIVTIGGATLPGGLGVVAACVGGLACGFGCPS